MELTNSKKLFERALKSIPGGVNSPVRSFSNVGGNPIFFESSSGPFIYDVDGNKYIDFVGSWGPMILGHREKHVLKGIDYQTGKAISFGAPTEVEIDLAETIIEMVPSIEKVRMMNSGTEATMTAVRLARGFTGKDLVIKFEGCYHGHSDGLLAKAGSGLLTLGIPDSPGIPTSITNNTLVLPYNDVEAVKSTFAKYSQDIACIILEPVAGNMGCIKPHDGYLDQIRDLTFQNHSLLIFDEVMTGFRLAKGGAQEVYDIKPDLTTMGKIVGGGLPVGALGGQGKIMDFLAPIGPVYQAGTLSGNPLAMSAGLSTLKQLNTSVYSTLSKSTEQLCKGLNRTFENQSITATINNVCGMFSIFFGINEANNFADVSKSDKDQYRKFFHGMLEQGIYLAPSPYEVAFLGTKHDQKIIEDTLEAAEIVAKQL